MAIYILSSTFILHRYHLQALRHFYMLATEPRVLITRECDTGQSCSVPVDIILKVCFIVNTMGDLSRIGHLVACPMVYTIECIVKIVYTLFGNR